MSDQNLSKKILDEMAELEKIGKYRIEMSRIVHDDLKLAARMMDVSMSDIMEWAWKMISREQMLDLDDLQELISTQAKEKGMDGKSFLEWIISAYLQGILIEEQGEPEPLDVDEFISRLSDVEPAKNKGYEHDCDSTSNVPSWIPENHHISNEQYYKLYLMSVSEQVSIPELITSLLEGNTLRKGQVFPIKRQNELDRKLEKSNMSISQLMNWFVDIYLDCNIDNFLHEINTTCQMNPLVDPTTPINKLALTLRKSKYEIGCEPENFDEQLSIYGISRGQVQSRLFEWYKYNIDQYYIDFSNDPNIKITDYMYSEEEYAARTIIRNKREKQMKDAYLIMKNKEVTPTEFDVLIESLKEKL